MIEQLVISNYKCVDRLEINLKNLNLLVGVNSSGKSTIVQGILLLSQNFDALYGLNGPLISVGEYREIKNFNVDRNEIIVEARAGGEVAKLSIGEEQIETSSPAHIKLADRLAYSNGFVHYLACDRIGSRDVYEKNRSIYSGVGRRGEYAIDYLSEYKETPLEYDICVNKDDFTLLSQVNYWLDYIIGSRIKADGIMGTDVIKASYYSKSNKETRPHNIGAGASYIISIIIMCLLSRKGDLLIIENPEIHLHPSAQSRLCEFLYHISNAHRQIIIETHSDHIFNGIRAGIASESVDRENVMIEFIKLGSDNCTRGYEINIGKHGVIENPIQDLFDQFEIDINRMLGI